MEENFVQLETVMGYNVKYALSATQTERKPLYQRNLNYI